MSKEWVGGWGGTHHSPTVSGDVHPSSEGEVSGISSYCAVTRQKPPRKEKYSAGNALHLPQAERAENGGARLEAQIERCRDGVMERRERCCNEEA